MNERLRKQNEGQPDSSIETIRSHVGQKAFASLAFDIYKNPVTGAAVDHRHDG
jgi:hypothetical protein